MVPTFFIPDCTFSYPRRVTRYYDNHLAAFCPRLTVALAVEHYARICLLLKTVIDPIRVFVHLRAHLLRGSSKTRRLRFFTDARLRTCETYIDTTSVLHFLRTVDANPWRNRYKTVQYQYYSAAALDRNTMLYYIKLHHTATIYTQYIQQRRPLTARSVYKPLEKPCKSEDFTHVSEGEKNVRLTRLPDDLYIYSGAASNGE